MPSGRTHDLLTILLVVPAAVGAYALTLSFPRTAVFCFAFLFGGVMFGPDLDTRSKQYSRWGVFRFLWFPYRAFFKHRSRFSHGLLLGTAIRVVYFMGLCSLLLIVGSWAYATVAGGKMLSFDEFTTMWRTIGDLCRQRLGEGILLTLFFGMWFGAASHTLTDLAGTYVKTGRRSKLF